MGKRVHSEPVPARHGGRHSTIVTDLGPTSHSTRTWSRTCSGTRCSHQRRMRARSSSGNPVSATGAFFQETGPQDGRAHEGYPSGAIDPGYYPGLSYWEDAVGNRVDGPQSPDEAWLRSHHWVWSRSRMKEVLAGHDEAVFVCGIARNQDELRDLFDRVFLLHIDEPTQEARLLAHDAVNPSGRSKAGRREIRDGRAVFEAQMLRHGAIALAAAGWLASVIRGSAAL